MKYSTSFLIFVSLLSNFIYSQIPTTPNVASLFKINPVNVNESAGTANISIPLYSLNVDEVSLPINLSYNSNGVKIEETAGNAGTGWSLLIGGVINRKINGQPDEFTKQVIKELEPGSKFDVFSNQYVPCQMMRIKSGEGWFDINSKNLVAAQYFLSHNGDMTNFTGDQVYNVFSGDDQPDIFNYILPTGKKGSFMILNKNNDIVSSTNDKIEAVYESTDSMGNFSIIKFTIIDDYGNSYVFDIAEQRNDSFYGSGFGILGTYSGNGAYTSGLFNYPSMSMASLDDRICPESNNLSTKDWVKVVKKPINVSWHISKITTKRNNIINFYYQDEYNNLLSNVSTEFKEDMLAYQTAYSSTAIEDVFTSKKIIRIETPSEYLLVNYQDFSREDVRKNENVNSLKAYKDLQFFNKENYKFKHIDFITSYKISPEIDLVATNLKYLFKRLYLDKVVINNDEIYKFDYNSGNLPHRHSFEQDYWGYYNANNAEKQNKTLLPDLWYYPDNIRSNTRPSKFSIYKKSNFTGTEIKVSAIAKYANNLAKYVADRSVNELTLKNGILEKITYPTKGYEKLLYESNDFMYEGDLKKGFGLRISSIEQYDSNNSLTFKTIYKYKTSNGNSSGVITNLPAFGQLYQTNFPAEDGVQSHFSSTSYSNDNNLYYSRVEKSNDGNGRIVTDFLIPFTMETETALEYDGGYLYKKNFSVSKFKLKSYGSFTPPVNSFEFPLKSLNNNYENLFGKISKITIFDQSDNKISFTENFYNLSNKSTNYISFSGHSGSLTYSNYVTTSIFADLLLSKEEKTLFYNTNTQLFDKSEYTYNLNGLLRQLKTTNSKGKVVLKEFKYPNDFTYRSSQFGIVNGQWTEIPITNIYSKMVDKNMINYPIEIISTVDNKVISAEISDFQLKTSGNGSVIAPAVRKVFEPSSVTTNYNPAKIDLFGFFTLDSNFKDKLLYDAYDGAGNLSMSHKPNDIYVTTIWGYNKRYPIAKIENASNSQIASALGVANLESINESNLAAVNALRTSQPNIMITTYTYKPLVGMTSMTDPNGYTTYYDYDQANRLKSIKDAEGNILSNYQYNYKQ